MVSSSTSAKRNNMDRQPLHPLHYTSFGWVDDDANFEALIAMNPVAYESALKMRRSTFTHSQSQNVLQQAVNGRGRKMPDNMKPVFLSIPTLPTLPLPSTAYVASAGGKKGKGKREKK